MYILALMGISIPRVGVKRRDYLSPASAESAAVADIGFTTLPHRTLSSMPQITLSPHRTEVSRLMSVLNNAVCENKILPKTAESPQSTVATQVPGQRSIIVFLVTALWT